MTTIDRVMFGGLWLAALAATMLTLRSAGGPNLAFALAPLLGAALATSFHQSFR